MNRMEITHRRIIRIIFGLHHLTSSTAVYLLLFFYSTVGHSDTSILPNATQRKTFIMVDATQRNNYIIGERARLKRAII